MEYSYELKYNDGQGGVLSYKFPADIDVTRLKHHIESFLLGATWQPETLNKLFGGELE